MFGGEEACVFQSTHPCGVRRSRHQPNLAPGPVSIHAPLRGATQYPAGHLYTSRRFNPRTPAGCDVFTCYIERPEVQFQSTHPCGVRLPGLESDNLQPIGFNPRTPAGCDRITSLHVRYPPTFQSTHPCGVRPVPSRAFIHLQAFQSTHPCGVRRKAAERVTVVYEVSIHAPLRGATYASLVPSASAQKPRFVRTSFCFSRGGS